MHVAVGPNSPTAEITTAVSATPAVAMFLSDLTMKTTT